MNHCPICDKELIEHSYGNSSLMFECSTRAFESWYRTEKHYTITYFNNFDNFVEIYWLDDLKIKTTHDKYPELNRTTLSKVEKKYRYENLFHEVNAYIPYNKIKQYLNFM